MILNAASSIRTSQAFERTLGDVGSGRTLPPISDNSIPLLDSRSASAPSVSVNLSAAARSASNQNSTDPFLPVYSRPVSSSSGQVANPEPDSSVSRQDSSRGSSPAVSSETDEDTEKQGSSSYRDSASNLTDQEMQVVDKLQARDREVRAHEQAHKAVGGQYAGAISFTYQSGPDGRRYAVGGEVPIDVSPIPGDPQATIAKMTIVKAAATAPAQPSTQDIMVAAEASRILMQAQNELMLQGREEFSGDSERQSQAQSVNGRGDETSAQNAIGERSSQVQTDVFQLISGLGSETESRVDILI